MPVRGLGPTCVVHACMRPARELGGYCIQHWMGLSPLQRKSLQEDVRGGDTDPIDSRAVAECRALQDLFDLPAVEPRRAA